MNLLFLAIIHYNMRQTALFMNYAKIKCISKSKIQLFFKSRFYLKVHQKSFYPNSAYSIIRSTEYNLHSLKTT